MKVVENSPQNARNCTISKNFLAGPCPQTPLAEARSFAARDMLLRGMYIKITKNLKLGPSLGNPAYAPVTWVIFMGVAYILMQKKPFPKMLFHMFLIVLLIFYLVKFLKKCLFLYIKKRYIKKLLHVLISERVNL